MKKISILIGFSMLALASYAQDKPAATPPPAPPAKETFKIDLTKRMPVNIKLDLPAYQVNDYFFFESIGPQRLSNASDLSAGRVTEINTNHQVVKDSLQNRLGVIYNSFVAGEQAKFTADTTAKYHPVAVKKGAKH